METRAAYVAVGTFVLALSIGVVIAVLWLAHAQFNEAKTRYDIYFAYVGTGLGQGSPVRISGVTVGRVVRVAGVHVIGAAPRTRGHDHFR